MIRRGICALSAAIGLYAQSAPAPTTPTTEASAQALVNKYCVFCHNDKLKTAGVSLERVPTTDIGAGAATWERVFRKVRSGEMPPLGLPRPDAAATTQFTAWLESKLDHAAEGNPNPGAPAVHRLNRAEYSNAIRDLLALDLDHSATLPGDDSGYGFDNIGDALTVSPLLLEKYMSTARKVARLAVGTVKASPAIERFSAGRGGRDNDALPPAERNGVVFKRYFPLEAEYSLTVRVRGDPVPNAPPPQLDLRLDGKRLKLFAAEFSSAEDQQGSRNFEVKLPITAGMHEVEAGFLSELWKSEAVAGRGRGGAPTPPPAQPGVDYVQVGGPFAPTSPGDTPSRRRIFICRPGPGVAEQSCANRILTSLAHQAYRRPVTQADIAPLMKLYAADRADGAAFDASIETGLRAILVSPDFLFRAERDPKSDPGSVHRVDDLSLASRLSFFLWSSIPDAELQGLAEKGKLQDPAVLDAQVRRMLADEKSKALVDNFAGQWLRLRNISEWHPDPDKFPQFNDGLRDAMRKESELFFNYVIHEDRSVLDLIDANYTFLNQQLAQFYQIQGVKGTYFRKVDLKGPERGGILTQSGILMVTAYPTRTSPVLRGKWILESLLGAPPPPPPPGAGVFAEESSVESPKSMRAQLEKHRANAGCAGCHSRMDPLGFALENYDPIGRFRTKDGDAPIDASGALPGGVQVNGPGDLKKVLLERKDQFVDTLAQELLTYALGRGTEYYDMPAVRQIRRKTAADGFKFSALVLATVHSEPFQMRRTPER